MKEKCKMRLAITFLVIVIMWLGTISIVKSEVSAAQEKVDAFIGNVLPIDKSQYNINLDGYYVSYPPSIKDRELNSYKKEHYRYSAVSDKSELSISCTVENGFLTTFVVSVMKGPVITDRQYSDLKDSIAEFLEKYHIYKNAAATEMKSMLQNIDTTKNQTLQLGDLKLKITNTDYPFSGHKTSFIWYRVINGCEYLELSIGYTDGIFTGLRDIRELYPIGDTTVNISKEQAIAIAIKYVSENYTYEMPGNVWIRDFNIVEENIAAMLSPTVRHSNKQYPIWSITLPLDRTYPGSVVALQVSVSAASGEVLLCSNQAIGGTITPSNDVDLALPSQTFSFSPSPASIDATSSNSMTTAIVATIGIAVIVALSLILIKKRSNT